MRYLLWLLMLFAAAVAVTLASHTPAYVLLLYPPYKIELSLLLFALLLVTLFVLGYGLVRFIAATLQLPVYVRTFRDERVQHKRRNMQDQALQAFFEGRYAAAEKAATQAMSLGEGAPLYPVLAARAAHAQQAYVRRDAYLSTAEREHPMRLLAEAEFMLDQRQPASALEALQSLTEANGGNHTTALRLTLKAYQQAGQWDEVLQVLAQLERRDAVDSAMATLLRQQAYLDGVARPPDLAAWQSYWKTIPAEFRLRSTIAAAAARALLQLDAGEHAATVLRDSLNQQWDSELAGLYGHCRTEQPLQQIEQAERWLQVHKNDAALLLTLGKLCTYQQLWGKAKTYLDASISVAPSAAGYTALAQLAEKLGEPAFPYYQRAADLSMCAS